MQRHLSNKIVFIAQPFFKLWIIFILIVTYKLYHNTVASYDSLQFEDYHWLVKSTQSQVCPLVYINDTTSNVCNAYNGVFQKSYNTLAFKKYIKCIFTMVFWCMTASIFITPSYIVFVPFIGKQSCHLSEVRRSPPLRWGAKRRKHLGYSRSCSFSPRRYRTSKQQPTTKHNWQISDRNH